ncbi:nicotinate phosphoribosyltransferase [Spongiactinospora rosea]|uniref:Nicotinate phosphoribosyltransferase n=2 Tax=Spongiactinospora rosea TaxID=2248750 RepID=A0A366LMI0_9ACTN|nr:nicotinate phosphoribosyltransferase [Spongiactinospora rosea]RBQ14870.1 nicotinate phosphoribosyltransferase [Spongiactinospora rosea]
MNDPMSTALLTDHYELTMVQAALRSGAAGRRTVFEVFARHLPGGRRYGVVAGVGRLLDALSSFRFTDDELAFLAEHDVVDAATIDFLAGYRFSGDVYGYREGESYFPGSPIMVVHGTFAESVVLETMILSILNHDSAITSAAARMSHAAGERPLIEMGTRRTHERAAVAAARAAYIGGFATSSNLRAGFLYGVPTRGTSAHAFTLLHDSERQAFQAQIAALGPATTLLIDTYDVAEAVRTAVELAGPELGAVRIDSGDLAQAAVSVRQQLDSLGADKTRIIVTGDLDEYSIAALAAAPVDGYGVGTSLVTGSGVPTAAMVYKMVARADPDGELQPVAKRSVGKPSRGGVKAAFRRIGPDGCALAEIIVPDGPHAAQAAVTVPVNGGDTDPRDTHRPLLAPLVKDGEVVGGESVAAARDRRAASAAELPPEAHHLSRGYAAIPTVFAGPWGSP